MHLLKGEFLHLQSSKTNDYSSVLKVSFNLILNLLLVYRKKLVSVQCNYLLTVSLQSDVMSSSGSSFQTAKLDVIPTHRHILKHDMTLNSSSFLLFKVI